uniref:Membrane protein n=1 Tax=Silurid herpesvirus 2 TaxID=2978071 RepID=A0A977TN68_9VIRU|nr:membrane protein [Silurid herpesvirus 2]
MIVDVPFILCKYITWLVLNAFVTSFGIYVLSRCIITDGLYGSCSRNDCVLHLVTWLAVCIAPALFAMLKVFYVLVRFVKLSVFRKRKVRDLFRRRNNNEKGEEEEEEPAMETIVDDDALFRDHPLSKKITVLNRLPSGSATKSSIVVFVYVYLIGYSFYSFSHMYCKWFVEMIPVLVVLKVVYISCKVCVGSVRRASLVRR